MLYSAQSRINGRKNDWMKEWGRRCVTVPALHRPSLCHTHELPPERLLNFGGSMTEHLKRLLALLQGAAVACALLWAGSAVAREDEIEPTAPPPPPEAAGKFG